jgi:hypothetical protein
VSVVALGWTMDSHPLSIKKLPMIIIKQKLCLFIFFSFS